MAAILVSCISVAAMTHDYKPSGLKQLQIIFTFLEVGSVKWVGRAAFFLENPGENPLSCLF